MDTQIPQKHMSARKLRIHVFRGYMFSFVLRRRTTAISCRPQDYPYRRTLSRVCLNRFVRRFGVPYGAALSALPLPRILRTPTNIAFESLGDLATNFVNLFGNRINSLHHRHTPQACLLGCQSPERGAHNHPGYGTHVAWQDHGVGTIRAVPRH